MNKFKLLGLAALLASPLAITNVWSHGDVTPQAVDVSKLKKLSGEQTANPYRGDKHAIEIGSSAYNQNCARCHGLGAVSGGIAPDLRLLPLGKEGDEYFAQKVRNGVIRNGVTYMPAFAGTFSEEAIWALRTYIESVHTDE